MFSFSSMGNKTVKMLHWTLIRGRFHSAVPHTEHDMRKRGQTLLMQRFSRCTCQPSFRSPQVAQLLLTNWRRSRWNWSPISWSFWPMQASVLRTTGPCWGSGSIPLGAPSVSRCLTPRSPKTSKRAGKCNRKPALPVGCQRRGLLFWFGRAQRKEQSWNLARCFSFYCDFHRLLWCNRCRELLTVAVSLWVLRTSG